MSDARPLTGRHALVTGGGRGIGAAIANELARLGADLTLLGRTESSLAAACLTLRAAHGRRVEAIVADVTDAATIERAFTIARLELGAILILINNAGAADSGPFRGTSRTRWDAMLAVNLTGPALCAQLALDEMVAAGWGRIVTIASTAGLKGYRYTAAYSAAKHGVIGLSRALALEYATSGVTVNAVCPGFTDTDLASAAIDNIVKKTGRDSASARAGLAAFNPQGRLIHPEEVAAAVGWLCLPSSAAITGQALVVAGGEV